MKTNVFILGLVAIFAISFFSCEKDIDFELHENENVFSSVNLTLNPVLKGVESLGLKSASVSVFDSIQITMFYEKDGAWIKVAKINFADTADVFDFKNPMKLKVENPLRVGQVLKAMCRFDIVGFSDLGEKTYYGIIEKDLRSAIDDETIVVPMVETKSYFGLNVKELTVNSYRYVFDYSYIVSEIDYERCAITIPPIFEQVPTYYYLEPGVEVHRQLIVQGENVTLDGDIVDYLDYIDMAEYWGAESLNGVDFSVAVYDGDSLISSSSINKNWLEFGYNHYVKIKNVTSGSFEFVLIDNEDVVEEWDLGNQENQDLKDGLVSWYGLDRDVVDLNGIADGTCSGGFYSSGIIGQGYVIDTDNLDYISLPISLQEEHSFSFWINVTNFGNMNNSAVFSNSAKDGKYEFWFRYRSGGEQTSRDIAFVRNGQAIYTDESYPVVVSVWNHFVVSTNDLGYSKIYMNGNLLLEGDVGMVPTGISSVVFGDGGSLESTLGTYDEIGYWNRELSFEEILILYNEGNGVTYSDF